MTYTPHTDTPAHGYLASIIKEKFRQEGYKSYFPPKLLETGFSYLFGSKAGDIINIKRTVNPTLVMDILLRKDNDDFFFAIIKGSTMGIPLTQARMMDAMLSAGIPCKLIFCLQDDENHALYPDNTITYNPALLNTKHVYLDEIPPD